MGSAHGIGTPMYWIAPKTVVVGHASWQESDWGVETGFIVNEDAERFCLLHGSLVVFKSRREVTPDARQAELWLIEQHAKDALDKNSAGKP